MRGMTIDEYAIITAFIQKHHKFGWVDKADRIQRKGEDHMLMIKYVDSCYDSRDKTIWCITIRQGIDGFRFSTNHFAVSGTPDYFKFNSLFDWVMAYLDGNWNNNSILRGCIINRDTPYKEEENNAHNYYPTTGEPTSTTELLYTYERMVKAAGDLPVGAFMYIAVEATGEAKFYTVNINLREETDYNISVMRNTILTTPNFYAFVHSEKGAAYVKEHGMEILRSFCRMGNHILV